MFFDSQDILLVSPSNLVILLFMILTLSFIIFGISYLIYRKSAAVKIIGLIVFIGGTSTFLTTFILSLNPESPYYNIINYGSWIFSIFLNLLVIYIINRIFIKPLKIMEITSKELSDGNFKTKAIVLKRDDEIGRLSVSISEIISKISPLLKQLRLLGDTLDTQLQQIAASTEELNSSTNSIVQAQEQVSSGAQRQVTLIYQANNNMSTLSTEFEKMKEELGNISKITALINEIAERTDMLALNAAIEAARAGSVGQGFGVVASQIRELADDSKKKAEEVGIVIEQIVNKSEQLSKSSEEVLDVLANVAKISDQTSQTTESVSAASEEMASAFEEITANIQQILETSTDVMKLLEIFKV